MREDIFEVGAEGMTVQDLAAMLALPATEIVKFLFMKGIMVQVGEKRPRVWRVMQRRASRGGGDGGGGGVAWCGGGVVVVWHRPKMMKGRLARGRPRACVLV